MTRLIGGKVSRRTASVRRGVFPEVSQTHLFLQNAAAALGAASHALAIAWVTVAMGCGTASAPPDAADSPSAGVTARGVEAADAPPAAGAPVQTEVTVLSRGRGVPEATWAAYQQIMARVDAAQARGDVVDATQTLIGLEGERRLCLTFRDPAAQQRFGATLQPMAAEFDLLRVTDSGCSPEPQATNGR